MEECNKNFIAERYAEGNCPICGNKCVKAGKTKAGTQRWLCKKCKTSLTHKIDNDSKELQIFLD